MRPVAPERWRRATPRSPAPRRDSVLSALAISALGCGLWLFLAPGGYRAEIEFFWVAQIPYDAALSLSAWRVSTIADGAARRFWRMLSGSALLWTTGDTIQTVQVLAQPEDAGVNGGLAQTSCFTTGVAALIVVMLLHPNAARSGRRRAAYWLDAGSILVGGAVVAWTFSVDPDSNVTSNLLSNLIGISVLLAAAYSAVKMVLGGHAPLTTTAATPMIVATFVQGIGVFAAPTTQSPPFQPWQMALRLLPSALLVAGPRIQQLQARNDPTSFAPRPSKTYSLLPYASIGATFLAELVVLPQGVTPRLWGITIGCILVTLLVVGRQLVAFHDNIALIRQRDAALADLRDREQRLFEQASFDPLTRLANRKVLTAEVTRALATRGPQSRLALLLIDLDDFKTVNDTLGHPAGDLVLTRAADVLRSATADTDLVARLGGDEFAVLLRDVDDALATKIAERILARLARPIRVADHELVIHASIGLTTASERDDQATLLRNADIALYQAKDQGKGVCTRYVPDMGARIQQEAALGTQLRQAVGSSQLYLVYQPMVHLATGNLVGAEALLRWQHPDKGGIEPRDFIPLAERTGLIVPIGRWLIHEACRQASAWQRDTEQGSLVMNVNVAGRQLKEPDFLDDVMAALTAARLPPARLCVEITENAVLEDEAAIAPLHGLREMGVSVALDDFGTGASSLGLLLTCPVTTLKLDRSFVESITTVPRQAAVARAVAEMATALQLQSVAEGIETPEQAAALRSLSYHHAQGYLFSRPLTADQFTHHWLANTPAGPSATLLSRSPPGAP